MKLPTIEISIPAYNEENNISEVLMSMLKQKLDDFKLNGIFVYSDASTDRTDSIVSQLQKKYPQIRLKIGHDRIGKIQMLNKIFHNCKSDYLLILDADMLVDNDTFVHDAIKCISNDSEANMLSIHQIPLVPNTFIGKIIHADFELWDNIRLLVPKRDHIHNYYCGATIYKRNFISNLNISKKYLDDERGYIYLKAKKINGFRFSDVNPCFYHAPETISDYVKMNKRSFGRNLDILEKEFGPETRHYYSIPDKYKLKGILIELIRNPIFGILALVFNIIMKIVSRFTPKYNNGLWEILRSTKHKYSPQNKTRIVFSSYDNLNNPYYGGGGAIAIHEIAKKLSAKYDILVFTSKYPGYSADIIDGITYRHIGLSFAGPKLGQLIFNIYILFYSLFTRYDIWIESLTPPFSVSLLPFFVHKPLVGLIHMLSGADMKRKYHLPFDLIERYGLPFYQNFIATTPATANYIKSICPKANLEIIPNGIKPMITHNNVFNKSVITFLGRIEINQKGLDLLISAFEHLKMPHTTLLIAGSGTKNEVEKLSDLISKSPNRDRIHLLGRVAGDKKKDLFAKSACIVIPSRFETFSIVALEALANRVSLVTFDITGLKWIPKSVRSYGTVLSPESLSSAIRRVLIDRTYRQSLTTQGYDFSRKFTWNNAAKKYDMFINQINCKTHTVPGITERIKRLSSSYASRLKNLLDIIYPNSLKLN